MRHEMRTVLSSCSSFSFVSCAIWRSKACRLHVDSSYSSEWRNMQTLMFSAFLRTGLSAADFDLKKKKKKKGYVTHSFNTLFYVQEKSAFKFGAFRILEIKII